MPPLPSDKISDVGKPTAGHAGSEACGEVVIALGKARRRRN
jgi:hypothetical protein